MRHSIGFGIEVYSLSWRVLGYKENYCPGSLTMYLIENSVISDPKHICAGVPQGFILGPLLYLVYFNDIVEEIQYNINSFADDTCLSMVVGKPTAADTILQNDINKIILWTDKWLVRFNPSKSESLIISRKRNKPTHSDLLIFNAVIPQVNIHKHLCNFISSNVSWDNHLEYIIDKSRKKISIMRRTSQICAW